MPWLRCSGETLEQTCTQLLAGLTLMILFSPKKTCNQLKHKLGKCLIFVCRPWPEIDHSINALFPHLKGNTNPWFFWSQSQPLGTHPVQVYLVRSQPVPLVPLSVYCLDDYVAVSGINPLISQQISQTNSQTSFFSNNVRKLGQNYSFVEYNAVA